MNNKKRMWECPICHCKLDRQTKKLVDNHKKEHPNNQRAFNPNG